MLNVYLNSTTNVLGNAVTRQLMDFSLATFRTREWLFVLFSTGTLFWLKSILNLLVKWLELSVSWGQIVFYFKTYFLHSWDELIFLWQIQMAECCINVGGKMRKAKFCGHILELKIFLFLSFTNCRRFKIEKPLFWVIWFKIHGKQSSKVIVLNSFILIAFCKVVQFEQMNDSLTLICTSVSSLFSLVCYSSLWQDLVDLFR